jgi:hypothetical protein
MLSFALLNIFPGLGETEVTLHTINGLISEWHLEKRSDKLKRGLNEE